LTEQDRSAESETLPWPEDLLPARPVLAFSYQTPLTYLPEPEHQFFVIPDPGEPYETPDGWM
jgi:hypothetical protein